MTQPTHNRQELLKQNFELTLIIIFIGLAFGLVGLVVPTAAVMSIVVISVGVIVGFVSYRDAFIPQPTSQMTVSTAVAQKLPVQMSVTAPVAQRIQASPPAPKPQAPILTAKPEQKPALQPTRSVEPLPRLPKIQRLPGPREATFPSQTKQVSIAPQQADPKALSEPLQANSIKPKKPRTRKTIDVPSLGEEKNA